MLYAGKYVACLFTVVMLELLGGCNDLGTGTVPVAAATYVLTVNSTAPISGVAIAVTPADKNNASDGKTSFTRTYAANNVVTLTAPLTASGNYFHAWSGCSTVSGQTCTVVMTADTTATAVYADPTIVLSPNPASVTIGGQLQITATVNSKASDGSDLNWSVAAPSGSALSGGSITQNGLYTTPYPAPATAIVTATLKTDSTQFAVLTITLNRVASGTGPDLLVNVSGTTQAISPYIYGMNGFSMASTTGKAAKITVDRWGGDATSLYNYVLDTTNAGSDWYFMNSVSGGGTQSNSAFNQQVQSDLSIGAKTLGTVPLMGSAAKDGSSCSFSVKKYGAQQQVNPYNSDCGMGVLRNGSKIANDPEDVYTTINPAFVTNWVSYLSGKFGTAANGGVAMYSLDNEPDWWDGGHIDAHPKPFTYDELVNTNVSYARAVKAGDATAEVSGPVMSYWWDFYYSKLDVENGWSNGYPCYQPWSNPADRTAHGGVVLMEYYLQQFKAAELAYNMRLLDYLDLHTYFAATYNGSGVGLTPVGEVDDTAEQQARINSTRVFWDSTYTDPQFPQPNYTTDANYTASCSVPLMAPQMIRQAQGWIQKNYPGTKLALTEYNWGGQDAINGAIAQADILGIFGREGLDLATLWGAPDPVKQAPGLMAFEIYRNYDGAGAQFGDLSLTSSSVDQTRLAIYGALRSSDGMVTVVVINKTYGDETATLSLTGLTPNGTAKVFLYSNANLTAIVPQADATVVAPATGSTASTISATYPAQSITLLVIPKK